MTLAVPTTLLAMTVLAGCGETDENPAADPGTTATDEAVDEASASAPGETSPSTPATTEDPMQEFTAGDVITQDDDGATLRLDVGGEATFRWEPSPGGIEPSVSEPEVVEVAPVDYFADPGFAEVALLGLAPGTSTVVLTATDDPDVRVELTVTVDGQG